MHPSAFRATEALVRKHVPTDGPLVVVDVGSQQLPGQPYSHRELFDEPRCRYIGVDVKKGNNVDVVLKKPYGLPFDNESVDVIVCGQVFEHIPFFWVTMMEFARILRPGGTVVLSAPSRGHVHHQPGFDGWRFYHMGFEALAAFTGLECLETTTAYPPKHPETRHFDYTGANQYWGDTTGAFRKGAAYDEQAIKPVRVELVAWANAAAGAGSLSPRPTVSTLERVKRGGVRRIKAVRRKVLGVR